jgi:hypothetical protein
MRRACVQTELRIEDVGLGETTPQIVSAKLLDPIVPGEVVRICTRSSSSSSHARLSGERERSRWT